MRIEVENGYIELDELVAFYDGLGFEVEFDDGSEALMKWEA